MQRFRVAPIPHHVPLELVLPEPHARLRGGGVPAAGMPVPETPVDHDHGPVLRKHKIGRAGKVPAVESEPEPQSVRDPANDHLRPGVAAADPRHDLASFLGIEDVGHRATAPEMPLRSPPTSPFNSCSIPLHPCPRSTEHTRIRLPISSNR